MDEKVASNGRASVFGNIRAYARVFILVEKTVV
jgi:hypothetical protein